MSNSCKYTRLSKNEAALLLVDHQAGLISASIRASTTSAARLSHDYNIGRKNVTDDTRSRLYLRHDTVGLGFVER